MMRKRSISRMRAIMSSPTRRSVSVCCARSRASSAMVRARARRSGTSGVASVDRAATTDIAAIVARMERPRNRGRCALPISPLRGGLQRRRPRSGDCAGDCGRAHLPTPGRLPARSVLCYPWLQEQQALKRASRIAGGKGVTAEAAAFAAPVAGAERAARLRVVAGWLWSGALLAVLTFLVLYPVAMLLLGALTNTNPVVDGFGVFDLSLDNFVSVLGNANVHHALANSLIACAGGTALAVVIGLAFSWIVVRTNTPWRGFVAAVSLIPLFVPPLVAGVAWSILGSPKSGLINTMLGWAGLTWRIDLYSMTGLILVFGMYYAPYVYMFTASALRNMDPSLEEAAEITGVSPLRTLFTVTFPLIAPAIVSGMLLSFIVMLGIYGIPAVLGAPANISVLTTYIFKLTNWSPPLYSTAAAVAIILMVVTGALVLLQQRVVSGRSYITVAGKAFRPGVMKLGPWRYFTLGLAVVYLLIVVVLPTLALIVAG